jgi:4-hydroxy 2-oxovalerate aldolase
MSKTTVHLDCTLRDGGYYNAWDFSPSLVAEYLEAMHHAAVDYVELGFRSLKNTGFKGAYAFSTDEFLRGLDLQPGQRIGVMVNAAEIADYADGVASAIDALFAKAEDSPVSLVRLAAHYPELEATMEAASILQERGYQVGVNLMQISQRSPDEQRRAAHLAQSYQPDAFYFADSMGCLTGEDVTRIIEIIRTDWDGPIGIHAHDNLGNALANTLRAHDLGATWLDSTVTGMGRGPGNTMTEYLAVELAERTQRRVELTPLFQLIRKYFGPMKAQFGWGTNPYYYLAGKHRIHPTYIQEMLADTRYSDEDIMAVIGHLKGRDAAQYNAAALEQGRHFYHGDVSGSWQPSAAIGDRPVLILGAGPSIGTYQSAIERYIRHHRPYVIALNTEGRIPADLIDIRAACHPVRLLADYDRYRSLPQPLATPASMLPSAVRDALSECKLLDFGLSIRSDTFACHPSHCVLPTSIVVAYALAIATSGGAEQILLAGLDGYSADDPRRAELDDLFALYANTSDTPFASITPTKLEIPSVSVFAL